MFLVNFLEEYAFPLFLVAVCVGLGLLFWLAYALTSMIVSQIFEGPVDRRKAERRQSIRRVVEKAIAEVDSKHSD